MRSKNSSTPNHYVLFGIIKYDKTAFKAFD